MTLELSHGYFSIVIIGGMMTSILRWLSLGAKPKSKVYWSFLKSGDYYFSAYRFNLAKTLTTMQKACCHR